MIEAKETLTGNINASSSLTGSLNTTIERIEPVLQDKVVVPSKEEQTIVADEGFNGLNEVKVKAITSEVDENIVAENIKDGVEILGVTGNFVGGKYAPRRISFSGYKGTELNYELANLDTSNITDMGSMFNSTQVSELDVSNFDTQKVTNMANMFSQTIAKKIDLSSFQTNNLTKMNNMFYYCRYLKELNISSFDTSKVTDMTYVFSHCEVLPELNISNFSTESATNLSYMFDNCLSLTTLDVSNFSNTKVTNTSNMFSSCKNLKTINLTNFLTNNVTSMYQMFKDCQQLTTLDLSSFVTTKVTNNGYMFQNCYRLTKLIINNPNVFELKQTNVFTSTPIAGYTDYTNGELGYVYVPDDLVEIYKTASVWSTYASQIKGISELEG